MDRDVICVQGSYTPSNGAVDARLFGSVQSPMNSWLLPVSPLNWSA